MKVLVFDIWGNYAHFKKIYATTSAVSYAIPSKTAIYGYVGAILGLNKFDNKYLESFKNEEGKIAIQILTPIVMQRINTNLRPKLGRLKATDNRKPTMVEYVYKPKYRIFFSHQNSELLGELKHKLINHESVYTTSLGLANLLSNFQFIGEFDIKRFTSDKANIHSIIPQSKFIRFVFDEDYNSTNEIVELSQYAMEMDTERNVTKRDNILLDRKGQAIHAEVKEYYKVRINEQNFNIVLF